jgi:hypothetical protein
MAPKEPTIPSRKSAEPGNQPQNQTPRSSPESAAPSKSDSAARSIANVGREDARPYVAKSAGGTKFTNEEIKLLEKNGDAIMNLDEDKTINAWIAWAAEASFPTGPALLSILTLTPTAESKPHCSRMA